MGNVANTHREQTQVAADEGWVEVGMGDKEFPGKAEGR